MGEGVTPFSYEFVQQILPVQTFNFSVEIFLTKFPSKEVSIKRTKRLTETFLVAMAIFFSIKFIKQSKTIERI